MKNLQNLTSKIKGSLYGFAIGDAMGATTEFMDETQIKEKYGEVSDIIGGGWLDLKAGDVTDDTQMMMCVCEAIEYGFGPVRNWSYHEHDSSEAAMLDRCCANFVDWYNTNPKDIGNCCRSVIESCINNTNYKYWIGIANNPDSLGNGSLMRTLPIILSGQSEDLAMLQGRLTHNNKICDLSIELYYKNLEELLYYNTFRNISDFLVEPSGHTYHTLSNALYWVQRTNSLEEAIVRAVNHGGDADTIAAITGSLAGALYGYDAIPQRWIEQLSPDVKVELDKYAKLFEKNNKKVCTNTK